MKNCNITTGTHRSLLLHGHTSSVVAVAGVCAFAASDVALHRMSQPHFCFDLVIRNCLRQQIIKYLQQGTTVGA
jgi:hypothetical protein